MTVENGKITQATEAELFAHYLKGEWYEIMSFKVFLQRCIELGTEVIENER